MSSLSQEQQRAVVMMRQQAQMQAQQEIMQVRTLCAFAHVVPSRSQRLVGARRRSSVPLPMFRRTHVPT